MHEDERGELAGGAQRLEGRPFAIRAGLAAAHIAQERTHGESAREVREFDARLLARDGLEEEFRDLRFRAAVGEDFVEFDAAAAERAGNHEAQLFLVRAALARGGHGVAIIGQKLGERGDVDLAGFVEREARQRAHAARGEGRRLASHSRKSCGSPRCESRGTIHTHHSWRAAMRRWSAQASITSGWVAAARRIEISSGAAPLMAACNSARS